MGLGNFSPLGEIRSHTASHHLSIGYNWGRWKQSCLISAVIVLVLMNRTSSIQPNRRDGWGMAPEVRMFAVSLTICGQKDLQAGFTAIPAQFILAVSGHKGSRVLWS
ncbi:hypothetical protein TrVFT333_001971 [Trichoderma virens FT-333]|nr:hypothetical protein TrVFT333_001971 [Trichoderma virens FT-333]